MKAVVYDLKGNKKSDMELPKFFSNRIREDLVLKFFEANKLGQPYSPAPEAGRRHSAAGTISHKRHDWKGHYGKGISRIPRKTMWRRGTNFYWVGAEISSVRGGRRAHPPKGIGKEVKTNLKEVQRAMESGFAATANKDFVSKRYERFDKLNFEIPIILESGFDKPKAKDVIAFLKKVFGESYSVALKEKKVRSGKGKVRGRKYKSTAGLLLVKSGDEEIKMKGIEVRNFDEVEISDLYPLGRLTVYTQKAMEAFR